VTQGNINKSNKEQVSNKKVEQKIIKNTNPTVIEENLPTNQKNVVKKSDQKETKGTNTPPQSHQNPTTVPFSNMNDEKNNNKDKVKQIKTPQSHQNPTTVFFSNTNDEKNNNKVKQIKTIAAETPEKNAEEGQSMKDEHTPNPLSANVSRLPVDVKYNTISFEIPALATCAPSDEKYNDQTMLLAYLEQLNPSLAHRYSKLPAYLHSKYFKQVFFFRSPN
jgi:hypothetical protein